METNLHDQYGFVLATRGLHASPHGAFSQNPGRESIRGDIRIQMAVFDMIERDSTDLCVDI
jgi:hypothetical protein